MSMKHETWNMKHETWNIAQNELYDVWKILFQKENRSVKSFSFIIWLSCKTKFYDLWFRKKLYDVWYNSNRIESLKYEVNAI